MRRHKILVIGAGGQIGSELTLALRELYGGRNVVASDVKVPGYEVMESGPFEILDVLDIPLLTEVVRKHKVTEIYLLAALLSATAEQNPAFAWRLNVTGLLNVLDLAAREKIHRIFWPSSIAVFGPNTPKNNTPQYTIAEPCTVYGISKQAGERWCEYYFNKQKTDVRSIRYPGLISYSTSPGGGTTDYAVHIFYEAVKKGSYVSYIDKNTALPMMYMPDAIRATIELMQAPKEKISVRSSYNISAISFAPKDLVKEIKKHIPGFRCTYKPDMRQKLAEGWPGSIDDKFAREDWGWKPDYDLAQMTKDMFNHLLSVK